MLQTIFHRTGLDLCRPKTLGARAFAGRHEISDPVGRTTYMSEYYGEKKLQDTLKNPMQPIRAGTASGVRANNPHPYEVGLAKNKNAYAANRIRTCAGISHWISSPTP